MMQGRWKQSKVGQAMLICLLTPPPNVGWAMGWSLGVGSIARASRVSTQLPAFSSTLLESTSAESEAEKVY